MKKLLIVLLAALMLTGVALSVSADPINVGGDCCGFTSGVRGHHVPLPVEFDGVVLCSGPINVGGD